MFDIIKSRAKFPPRASLSIPLLAIPLVGWLQVCAAEVPSPRTFASAEEASHALFLAVESDDITSLTQILGANNELTSTSDPTQDRLDREQFERKYREMHRLAREHNGEVVLYVGAENWPFPIPLVSHGGVWRYDSDAGAKEVLYRRVGENEVTAIETCHALIATVQEPQEHADASNTSASLLSAARAGNKPVSFHGYSFRLLSKPGSSAFGIVAYPTLYGSSGVMTFEVNDAGVVYQKDLGANTGRIATKMAVYQADATWTPAEAVLDGPG
jgi:Protein of unknown function (DUF2950)